MCGSFGVTLSLEVLNNGRGCVHRNTHQNCGHTHKYLIYNYIFRSHGSCSPERQLLGGSAVLPIVFALVAASVFDPTEYVKRRELDQTRAVRQAIVEIDGVWYRRFETERGAIIVPRTGAFLLHELSDAVCADGTVAAATAGEADLEEKVLAHSDAIEAAVVRECRAKKMRAKPARER